MAKAERRVEREVIEHTTILLELTPEEAAAVKVVAGHVSGSATRSARKHTSAVFWALSAASVADNETMLESLSGHLSFNNIYAEGEA